MDYFKSAASALLAKAGPLPNYALGERDSWYEGRTIWSLYPATKRDDGSRCTILIFDAMQPSHNPRKSLLPLAKNALRRFRTTRHPDIVKLIDSVETPNAVYIVLENVRPLGRKLEEMQGTVKQRDEWVGWGLSKIANAVRFLNSDMNATHGNIRIDSIFLSDSGEWRLGGLETLSSISDESCVLYNMGGLIPDAARYAPPEVKQQGWNILRDLEVHAADSYSFALVVMEAYNGVLPPVISNIPSQGRVPGAIYALSKRLMLPNAKSRLSVSSFYESGSHTGGFFAENRLVKVASGLDSFILASEEEKGSIIRQIKTSSDSFPPDFLQHKVLPSFVNAIGLSSSGNASPSGSVNISKLLPLILQLGAPLSDADWSKSLAPIVFKAFASPDRTVRMQLLELLPSFTSRLSNKQVADKIWPNLLTGFGDSAPAIREATVKSILPLSSNLTERILNNDLLRQLARTQVDPEAGIRTNTTILLGNLAPKLSLQTRKKVLIPAFVRSLKDPFVHARNAGIMAFLATSESFDGEESARLILPALCPSLIDSEKSTREQAKTAVTEYLKKVDSAASKLPISSEPEQLNDQFSTSDMQKTDIPSTPASAASALTQWTVPRFSENETQSRSPQTSFQVNEQNSSSSPVTNHQEDGVATWSSNGDLMDVMDDESDWTNFETGISKVSSPLKKANITTSKSKLGVAKPRSEALPSNRSVTSLQDAFKKTSFAVQDTSNDDDAWDESLTGTTEQSGVTDVDTQTADAFASENLHETKDNNQQNDTEVWGTFNDDENDELAEKATNKPKAPQILTKEERRAEMERKREERKARLAQLKQSKAAKLAADVQ